MTLRLQSGGPVYTYGATTDQSGYFTVTTGLAPGDYLWRVKEPQTLANSGSATLSGPLTTVEMGTLREGDANNDNCVTVVDFNVLRSSYGKTVGDPGYDARADFNADRLVNVSDYSLLRTVYGSCGAPVIPPALR
jgi:hypothetical protein